MNSPTISRLALLPERPAAGKRPAIRRYKLGRVHALDVGTHMTPVNAPARAGVRAP